MSMLKIKGKTHLVKDPSTNAIVNVDEDAYRAARKTKQRVLESIRKEKEMQERIERLEAAVEKLLEGMDSDG